MRFNLIREFYGSTPEDAVKFLRSELGRMVKELSVGLRRLTFGENFESFEVEVTIAAGAEAEIRNQLQNVVPTKRVIVRSNSADIVDGDTEWTQQFVYLKNTGASAATARVIFFR